jgi:hypothetical protein
LIRNSCSTGWGDKRLRLAPYEYVLKGLNEDWWSFLKNEWIDTGNFGNSGTEAAEKRNRLRIPRVFQLLRQNFLKLNHCIGIHRLSEKANSDDWNAMFSFVKIIHHPGGQIAFRR